MSFDNLSARPRSASTQVLSSMGGILSLGHALSIPLGQFSTDTLPLCNLTMQTVYTTRRLRLEQLKVRFKSWAALNEALGWERTSARLSQIYNRTERKDRGTYYEMGDPTAREIEARLELGEGWMDTPPSNAELYGENDPRTKAMVIMEDLPADQWGVALRLLSALAQPAPPKTGTQD